jgi:hypothetical protein
MLVAAIEGLFDLHLNVHRTEMRILHMASTIALKGKVTVYDAVPVALAETRGTVCVRADESTQYKRLKAKAYPVRLLHSQESDLAGSNSRKARAAEMKHLLDQSRSDDA